MLVDVSFSIGMLFFFSLDSYTVPCYVKLWDFPSTLPSNIVLLHVLVLVYMRSLPDRMSCVRATVDAFPYNGRVRVMGQGWLAAIAYCMHLHVE